MSGLRLNIVQRELQKLYDFDDVLVESDHIDFNLAGRWFTITEDADVLNTFLLPLCVQQDIQNALETAIYERSDTYYTDSSSSDFDVSSFSFSRFIGAMVVMWFLFQLFFGK